MRPRVACLAFFFAVTNAFAWNTETPVENTKTDWQSLYVSTPIRTDTTQAWHNNEHARLAHMAMKQLGLDNFYSIRGPYLVAIDLNASLFRPSLKQRGAFHDLKASPLEERLLPPPVHFAGLPDISYTMYDWINKNAFCPPGIPSSGGRPAGGCHAFVGWMGALNSSHFGTQAERWYRHLHAIALDLAGRAREMREKMRKHGPKTVAAYKGYLKEAEYEALAFEGYAQHFLQDRWSIGHMWERWNAADYGQLVFKTSYDNFEVAAASGLMHGSEAITGQPDPLSSPFINVEAGSTLIKKLFGTSSYVPYIVPTWRHLDMAPHPGVGDNRVGDMLDHLYGKEFGYPDRPLEVGTQKKNMLRCMMGGWVDVIKGFGLNKGSGGYGVNGVKLPNGINGLSEDVNLSIGCFDNWATNRSMALGWTDLVTTFGSFARIAIGYVIDYLEDTSIVGTVIDYIKGKPEKRILNNDRIAWVKITYRVWRYALTNPDGTNLARGDIGSFGTIQHGGQYRALPKYIEPKDLEELPDDLDKNGRDKKAVFGFFNRAHTDWWCSVGGGWRGGLAELNEWRGSEDKAEQAACRLIADRYYAGTDREYQGKQKERRTVDGLATGEEVVPVCAMYHRDIRDSGYDERVPITLAPGYVAEPYTRSADDFSTESIANWCKEIPVLDLLPQPENANEDLVALVHDPKRDRILLRGHHLGNQPGTLTLDGSLIITKSDILDWDGGGIIFRLNKGQEFEERDYSVKITRADGVSSVGRFFLRVVPKKEEVAPTVNLTGCWRGNTPVLPEYISIFQTGRRVIATVPLESLQMKPGIKNVEVVHTGIIDLQNLTVSNRARDFGTVSPLLWGLGIDSFPEKQRDALVAFGLESRFKLRIVAGASSDWLALEGSPDAAFHLAGTYFPFHSNAQTLFPYYRSSAGPLIVPGSQPESVVKESKKECQPPNFLLFDVNESATEGSFMCWYPLGDPGSKQSGADVVWEKVASLEIASLSITDTGFTRPLDEIPMGGDIQIRAKASSACPGIRDRLEATIFPEDSPDDSILVRLTETGPDTAEFRSNIAIVILNLKTAPGLSIVARLGGEETSVTVKAGAGNQAANAPPLQSRSGKTGGTQDAAAAGSKGNDNQIVAPVSSRSGKGARVPMQAPAARQAATKPIQWVVYKLESHPDWHGGLPKLKVIKIAFRRSAKLAQLHVRSYPVSLSRNDQTGEILWSVNWSNGSIEDQQIASTPATMGQLQQKADGMKPGTVVKTDLATLIGRQLGPGSRHL